MEKALSSDFKAFIFVSEASSSYSRASINNSMALARISNISREQTSLG